MIKAKILNQNSQLNSFQDTLDLAELLNQYLQEKQHLNSKETMLNLDKMMFHLKKPPIVSQLGNLNL